MKIAAPTQKTDLVGIVILVQKVDLMPKVDLVEIMVLM